MRTDPLKQLVRRAEHVRDAALVGAKDSEAGRLEDAIEHVQAMLDDATVAERATYSALCELEQSGALTPPAFWRAVEAQLPKLFAAMAATDR